MKKHRLVIHFDAVPAWERLRRAVLCGALLAIPWVTRADEPEPPRVGPDIDKYAQGSFIYENNCQICHGKLGDGRGEMAASLGIKPRSFKTGLFKYRSTPYGKLPTTEDLKRTVRGGLTGTAMGMFTSLSESDLDCVVEYVKFFSRKWRKAENYAPALSFSQQPLWLADEAQREVHVDKGKQTFQLICAACHGPAGDGKGPAAAALQDELGEPSAPADLRQPHLRSGDEPADIFRTLTTGLNGTPMVSFADTLSEEQKWDVIAYILTLRRDFSTAGK